MTTSSTPSGDISGIVPNTTLASFSATTSAQLAGVLTDETGTGVDVFNVNAVLVTPNLGTPSAVVLTNATGTAASLTAGTATNATNVGITDDTTTNATMYLSWHTAATGNLPTKVSSTKLTFNPSTAALTTTSFVGALTGNASTSTTLQTARALWGQNFDGSAAITGNLTSVGNITGGASSMTITAGTGNSRTMALQSTTSGGTATTFLTGNADQTATFASSAAATAFIPSGSTVPTNGLYLPSANSIAWATNTVKRAQFDSSGYYGLGCTPVSTVAARFQDPGNNDAGIEFIRGSSTTMTFQGYDRNGSAYINFSYEALSHTWKTSGTTKCSLTSTALAPSVKITLPSLASSTTAGDMWYDSTQKSLGTYLNGIVVQQNGCIYTTTADKTVANTTTETSIIGTGVGTATLPTNFFVAGKTIRIKITGYIADLVTPTLNVKFYYGATAVWTSGAIALVTLTGNNSFTATIDITCRTTGASGSVMSQGNFTYLNSTTVLSFDTPSTAAVTIDTTASSALDCKVTWGTANASNTITATNATIEVIN